jgi:hypothetical protein
VEFFDLRIWVDDHGVIQTDLFTKDNAKNSYLLPKSNHPSHCCKSIPYSLAFRVLRNCSLEEQREIGFQELKIKLLERGYRSRSIEDSISKVKTLRRGDVLKRVERNTEENQNQRLRAIFKFDQRLPNLSKIMHTNWQTLLSDDSRLLSVFPEPPMVCYKRGRNLREILCQARLPPGRLGRHEDGFKRCL